MSSQQPKKKITIAQWRADKERREQDVLLGCQLASEVNQELKLWESMPIDANVRYDQLNEMLGKTSRAFELLKNHLDSETYHASNQDLVETFGCGIYDFLLYTKGRIHYYLGHQVLALGVLQQAQELFKAAEREGVLKEGGNMTWREVVKSIGAIYFSMRQLEPVNRCFLKVLAWRGVTAGSRVMTHYVDHYYKERKAWAELTECCKKAIVLLPEVAVGILNDHMKERLLILLADAAEGRGDMSRALEYDQQAKSCWVESGKTSNLPELVACAHGGRWRS